MLVCWSTAFDHSTPLHVGLRVSPVTISRNQKNNPYASRKFSPSPYTINGFSNVFDRSTLFVISSFQNSLVSVHNKLAMFGTLGSALLDRHSRCTCINHFETALNRNIRQVFRCDSSSIRSCCEQNSVLLVKESLGCCLETATCRSDSRCRCCSCRCHVVDGAP